MVKDRGDAEPTLIEAWTMLGTRLGLSVVDRGRNSITASGTVHGRRVSVEIEGAPPRSEFWRFLFNVNTISSRNRREKWHSVLVVGRSNPTGPVGLIESKVDVNDPSWVPGQYNPRNGRKVTADSAGLGAVLAPELHERLMNIMDDVRIEVGATDVRIDHHNTARPSAGANYVAGSFLHHYLGTSQPWPERALVGPPQWITLLCDLADAIDRVS